MRNTLAIACVVAVISPITAAKAWDSAKRNPTHPTHSYLTEEAISALKQAEVTAHTTQLNEGANTELHELPVKGSMYGLDLETLRVAHKGTNAGTDDIKGWWADAQTAYRAGHKQRAYFLTGIMLHMIQDMGVPAHANGIYHQGNATEFDNFEFMALSNWKPDYTTVNKIDPGFLDPSDYYAFSKAWANEDAPDYLNKDSFSKFWTTASKNEKKLLRKRQARTVAVVMWTLNSAHKAFQ